MGTAKKAKERLLRDRRRTHQTSQSTIESLEAQVAAGLQREKELAEVLRIDKEEVSRVGHNWRTQPGPQMRSAFLMSLGEALETATTEQAMALKMAFPDEWEQWDGEFDPVTGRALADEDEEYEKDDNGRYRAENGFDQRDHYREM